MTKREIIERRSEVYRLAIRGLLNEEIAKLLGCSRRTVGIDVKSIMATITDARSFSRWSSGERIRLIDDGWGGFEAGQLGTVVKVLDEQSWDPVKGHFYAVAWDCGAKDCIYQYQAKKLSPLEQIASVVE